MKTGICLFLMLVLNIPVCAAEIHSNMRGGGLWSDPRTWHGGKVPTPEDSVVVAMRDTVVFDLEETTGPTCGNLYIDPEGMLTFKPSGGHLVLTVNGSVESYGTIRINAVETPQTVCELRLLAVPEEQRNIRLMEGASLLVYGHKGFAERERNVVIATDSADPAQPKSTSITAERHAMIDLNHSELRNVVVQASTIDNTGAQADERLNIIGNVLLGLSRIDLYRCDTPVIQDNILDSAGVQVPQAAIYLAIGKLGQIKGNQIAGIYGTGIHIWNDQSSVCTDNVINNCDHGVQWQGSDGVIRNNAITDCANGMTAQPSTGVVENVVVQNAARNAFYFSSCQMQMTGCRAETSAPEAVSLAADSSQLTLLNCDIPYQRMAVQNRPQDSFQTMQFLVVKVTGNVPPSAQVEVRTAEISGGIPIGKADLNVRNSPAKLDDAAMTPLPGTQRSLVVRSWSIGVDKSKVSAPFYDIRVLAPQTQTGVAPQVLASVTVDPADSWQRPEPDAPIPTVEITVP